MKKHQTGHSASLSPEELTEHPGTSSAEIREKLSLASQSFFYPGSKVLKNKHSIKDTETLKKQCAEDVEREMIQLRQEPLPAAVDSSYLKYIHKRLFRHTFEWAGETRAKPFTFRDGNVAYMPIIKRKEFRTTFATSRRVEEGLKNLDQALAETNYLKGLTREEFVEYATGLMINLQHLHPFREGNRRTQRMFFEKLAESAGHKLDFSCVTKKRKMLASIEAMDNGNPEPMKHLLEDISNPEKLLVLNEFINEMRELGLDENNYKLAVVAQDGITYHGTYRGAGDNGFMMDVNGTFIIGSKKHLTPEQLKTLKIGDTLSFTAPQAQDLQKTLIPSEKIAPLTTDEIAERVYSSALVQESMSKIEVLCKVVYGNSHILRNKMPKMKIPVTVESINEGEQFARQVGAFPQSIRRLRGTNICGLKSGARQHAEANILPLSHAIFDYVHAVRLAEKDVLEAHQEKQQRCEKSVKTPSEEIKNLFSLSKEQQQEVLLQSPELKAEMKLYMSELGERLSLSEQRAIRERNHRQLAGTIGTSLNNAKEIAAIFQKGTEIQQNMQAMSRTSYEHSTQSVHQSTRKNKDKEHAKALTPSAIKAKKVTTIVTQEKAVQQSVRPHKIEHARAITI
ncbi:BID domain-containing T4SS effector [Bartonella gliris]|uniref:BID domain-containing T4SS effector n=1 Tax=Bartonella gliris TaxID=3004109 RepID=UPI0038737007